MRFKIDHDLHIHSRISPCAGRDPRQTGEAILAYGIATGKRLLNLADHIWDEKSPSQSDNLWLNLGNDMAMARSILPLPQSKRCNFLFGMEVDMDLNGCIAASPEEIEKLDFLVFAPSHLHLGGFTVPHDLDSSPEVHKKLYIQRMEHLLSLDLPFHKTGLAHPTCSLACSKAPLAMFDSITDGEWEMMWTKVRDKGMGVEINEGLHWTDEQFEHIIRPYRIAKALGCKFYLGSDAHTPEEFCRFDERANRFIDALDLTEDDKLPFVKEHLASEA